MVGNGWRRKRTASWRNFGELGRTWENLGELGRTWENLGELEVRPWRGQVGIGWGSGFYLTSIEVTSIPLWDSRPNAVFMRFSARKFAQYRDHVDSSDILILSGFNHGLNHGLITVQLYGSDYQSVLQTRM